MSTKQVVDRFIEAIERSDIAAISDLYSEDLVVWYNTNCQNQNKEQNIEIMRRFFAIATAKYTILERRVVGGRLIQRHEVNVSAFDGQFIVNPVAMFITVNDGLITHIEEYQDSAKVIGGVME
jgi:ketosteroid isomerase-like protein